ncbi:AAA family ATPase [Actinoplanes sp. N902-109]|uniref:AAA family ATPase n=1 Tax=Actinoplanes sp. (strain N902-109) TaxID=649831 RepID=UPI0003294A46|nr:AAA family ATPase [Actinoplanes sp. N902-109]AGL17624.1 hypothetical protein L083_4114 [Actinoplanes sp. N902-109]
MTGTCWIGGAPGAGKSTLARRLAAERGAHLYATDDVMRDHAARAAEAPYLTAFLAMTMDERWLTRSPQAMLDEFHWFRGEAFDLIVDDLRGIDADVVVEGFRLLPHLVAPLLGPDSRAVWLLPTPEFRAAALASRGDTWTIAGRTSDPPRALHNLAVRDRLFTERLTAEVERLGLPSVRLAAGMTEDDAYSRMKAALRAPA